MDAQMTSEVVVDGLPTWDFQVDTAQGIVPMVSGESEAAQGAAIAAFLQKDSTPQLDGGGQGVDWAGFFTQRLTFGELDANIRTAIQNSGYTDYGPSYDMTGDALTTVITKQK